MNFNDRKLNKIKEDFKTNGYVTLKNFFQKEQIKSVKKNLFNFLNKKKKKS